MYACMRMEEKDWVRERHNSKGRTCHVKGTSITATGRKKKKLSGSLASSHTAVIHPVSASKDTINTSDSSPVAPFPSRLHFSPSAILSCTQRDLHLIFKFN